MATKDVVPRGNNEGKIGRSGRKWTEVNATTVNAGNVAASGNATVTGYVSAAQFSGTGVVTESQGISSNDVDTKVPSAAAVKDYVDAKITLEDLDVTSDSGTIAIDLDSETLTIAGGVGIATAASSNTVTVTLNVDDSTVEINSDSLRVKDSGITFAKLAAAAIVIESEGIGSNDNDTTLPTSAAVKAYVDAQTITKTSLNNDEIITATGASAITGESNLTFNGSTNVLTITGTAYGNPNNNRPAFLANGDSTNEGDFCVPDSSHMVFGHHTNDGNTGGLTERMRIESGGDVGIGTTNPTTKLEVNGVVKATGFTIGNAEITETELEILDGASVTTAELNLLDDASSSNNTAGKAAILDGSSNLVLSGDLTVGGGDIKGPTDSSLTFRTDVNFAIHLDDDNDSSAQFIIYNGANSSKFTVDESGNTIIGGNLTVNGTTTTVNSTTVQIDDLNLQLADGAAAASSVDGGGITLAHTGTDFTLAYNHASTAWKSNIDFDIANSKEYKINGTSVLTANGAAKVQSAVAGTGLDHSSGQLSVDVSDFMANGSNNRIVTATGTDGMNAEANLTFDGSTLTVSGEVSATTFDIGGTNITADATEINKLDGVTATTAELNYLDITTLGTVEASKAVTADASGHITIPQSKELRFDSSDTKIWANTSSSEDLYIEADDDIFLRPDDDLYIYYGTTLRHHFDGSTGRVGINKQNPSTTLDVNGVVTATGFTIGSAAITETELEILDGATLSTTELNYVDGVTSAIQTQLDSKAASSVDIVAGTGLSGGGDLTTNRTLALDAHELSALGTTADTGDYFVVVDSTDNTTKKVLHSNTGFGASNGAILSNGSNNRIVTATGATNINGEANLTFNGSTLALAGDLNVDTGTLFVDASDNEVRIGTTSAVSNEKLLVRNTSAGYATGIMVSKGGNNGDEYISMDIAGTDLAAITAGAVNDGNCALSFRTSDTSEAERMRITHDGKVGINEAAPGTALAVLGDLALSDDSSNKRITLEAGAGNNAFVGFGEDGNERGWIGWKASGQKVVIGTVDDAGTHDDVLVVDGDYVGINAATPESPLHVKKDSVTNADYDTQYNVATFEGSEARVQILASDGGSNAATFALTNAPSSGNNKHWMLAHRGTSASGRFEIGYLTNSDGDLDFSDATTCLSIENDTKNVGLGIADPAAGLHLYRTGTNNATVRIEATNTSYHPQVHLRRGTLDWYIRHGTDSDLAFIYETTERGYLDSGTSVGQIDFTGQHKCAAAEGTDYNLLSSSVGKIIVSSGTYKNLTPGSVTPEINESLPTIELSSKRNQKSVYGVISDAEDPNDNSGLRKYTQGNWGSVYDREVGDDRITVNSVGEGGIWITNINGNLENGDYITTCEIAGYGMKQDSEMLCNYTVAKITMDCDFDKRKSYQCIDIEHDGQTYRAAFVGCTYHCG